MIQHKYLNEIIETEYQNDLFPFNQEGYPDCEEFGFDVRETFEFDTFLMMFLYERFRYFQEEASKVVNFEFHKVDIYEKEKSVAECIQLIVDLCKVYLYEEPIKYDESGEIVIPTFEQMQTENLKKHNAAKELFYILGQIYPHMWW